MSTQQRMTGSLKVKEEIDEISTQAESMVEFQRKSIATETGLMVSKVVDKAIDQHQIAGNVSKSTFNSDKIFKLTSAILKVFRSYGWTDKVKGCEKFGGQIGQVRRLLRVDRVFMLLKEFAAFSKKKNTSTSEKLMIIFKIMILMEDFSDLRAYLIQLKILKGDHLLGDLRKKVALFYFLECLGWFIYHTKEYFNSKTEDEEYRNRMAMLKYTLDGLLAHNQIASRLFALDPKNIAILSVMSAALNMYLVWK